MPAGNAEALDEVKPPEASGWRPRARKGAGL